jgi:protein-disulfide isomerase
MTEECEECGKEFDSERGLHIHQAQKHKEDEDEQNEKDQVNDNQEVESSSNPDSQGITLSTEQFGGLTFMTGLFLGIILGGLFFGASLTGNMGMNGAPSVDQGNSGDSGSIVELSNTEYPYGDLEVGTGIGEKTFGNTTINVEGEPYIGSSNAEVTAVSYEDFECPFCSQYNQNAYPQIVENYVQTGEVQYFFKNLPLPQLHPWAEPSAIASECALNQNAEAFWTFKQGFFNNQEALGQAHQDGTFDESMYRWAEQTGLDTDQFRTCYDNEEELDEVNQDKTEAGNNGASATPSILINGELVEGAQPYSRFESVIESKLG